MDDFIIKKIFKISIRGKLTLAVPLSLTNDALPLLQRVIGSTLPFRLLLKNEKPWNKIITYFNLEL
ncbi:MAG: hypothetical protein EA360_05600 [Balneolaceae bacterium]|nr:MAG: hypothetical protein EA360_05600 [Balneolaceae bacterium]